MLTQSEIDAINKDSKEALKIFKTEFFKSIIESGQSEKYAKDMWLIWWKLSSNAIKKGALNGISKIVTEERQRAKVLLDAAKEILHLHLCEQEGLSSGKPTFQQWFEAVNKLSESINTYNKNKPNDRE